MPFWKRESQYSREGTSYDFGVRNSSCKTSYYRLRRYDRGGKCLFGKEKASIQGKVILAVEVGL